MLAIAGDQVQRLRLQQLGRCPARLRQLKEDIDIEARLVAGVPAVKAPARRHQLAQVMAKEADRLNRVVSELLELVRPAHLNYQTVDINALIRHSLQLVSQDAQSRGIALQFTPRPELTTISADPDRLNQGGEAGTLITNGSVKDANGIIWNLPAQVTIGIDGTVIATATCSVAGAVPDGDAVLRDLDREV